MGFSRRIGSSSRVLVLAACAALAAGLSCSSGATGPSGSTGSTDTAVAAVHVVVTTSSIYVGQTTSLTAVVLTAAGDTVTGHTVSWASSDTTIASVTTGGVVTGRGAGSATITAAVGSTHGSAALTVALVPVATVTIQPKPDTLLPGQVVALSASERDAAGNLLPRRAVTWAPTDSTIATVSSIGLVTAHDTGTTYVIATVESARDSAQIVVRPVPVASVTVTPALDSLVPQDTVTLVGTAYDSAGGVLGGRTVTWSSSGPSIATVSAAGLVTAQDTGTAYIIATIDTVRDSATIVVYPPPVAGLLLGTKGYGVATGDSVLVTATAVDATGRPNPYAAVTWTSRDPTIASVDSAGYVTGQAAGETDVLATSGGFTDSTHVLVGTCATTQAININNFSLPIEAGGQWNNSGLAPSGQYRTNGTITNSGVAFGTDGSHLALGTNITGTWDTGDIALDPVCAYQTTAVNRTLVDLTVASTVGLDSLDVVQETWAVPDQANPTASYILFRYTFTNERSQPLANFHAAYLADWDIQDMNGFANPAQNLVRYDSTTGVGEATGADTVNYSPVFGVVPVAASGVMNFKGWANGTGTLGDPQTDADIFAYLSAGIDTTVPSTATDIRELMGVGPVTIPAGGRYVVYFAVLGADDQAAFTQAVAAARARAQTLGF